MPGFMDFIFLNNTAIYPFMETNTENKRGPYVILGMINAQVLDMD